MEHHLASANTSFTVIATATKLIRVLFLFVSFLAILLLLRVNSEEFLLSN